MKLTTFARWPYLVFSGLLVAALFLAIHIFDVSHYFDSGLTFRTENKFFDSGAESSHRLPVELAPGALDGRKRVDIEFRMRISEIRQHDNVFQTAPLNEGIRLEISEPAVLGLVVGSRPVVGAVLTSSLVANKWYAVSIRIDRLGALKVTLDGQLVANRRVNSNFDISDIIVGSGFSDTRHFSGQIEDFRLRCDVYKKRPVAVIRIYHSLFLVSTLIFLIQSYWFVRERQLFDRFLAHSAKIFGTSARKPRVFNALIQRKAIVTNLMLIVGTMSAIVFHYVRFAFMGDHAPHFTSFLHYPINIFADFYSIFDEYARKTFSGVMNYFPGAYIPLSAFYASSGGDPYLAIKIYVLLYLGLVATYLYTSAHHLEPATRILTTFAILAFSYSILFSMHTANLEGVCFVLIAFAIGAYIKRYHIVSASLIGLAASIKLLPGIFLLAILERSNRSKAIVAFSVSFVVFVLLPFAVSGSFIGNINEWLSASKSGMGKYYDMMVLSFNGLIFGHSLLNAIRLAIGPDPDVSRLMPYYYLFAVAVGLISVYAIVRSRFLYQKVLIGACTICLLPPTSTDYKLEYFLIPLVLILGSRRPRRVEAVSLILIALIQIPKGYIYFYSNMYANINITLNALLMTSLLVISISTVFRRPAKGEATRGIANNISHI